MPKKRKLEPKTPKSQPPPPSPSKDDDEEQPQPQDEDLTPDTTAPPSPPADLTGSGPAETPEAAPKGGGNGESEVDEEEDEPLHKLLQPFSKDQLEHLLCEAASSHPDLLHRIRRLADADHTHRKIFVHGLGWDTTADTLLDAFKPYGDIEDCNAVSDKLSGKSKGYGFILFKHRAAARRALREPQKRIGNRMTACQLASAGPVPAPPPPISEYTQRKIYVSNVASDVDPHRLLHFFAKYGEIEEGPLGLDKTTGKPKGFALFVYKAAESAKKALEEPHKSFDGRILHCQKAIDGPKPSKDRNFHPSSQLHHHHHHLGLQPFSRSDHSAFLGGAGGGGNTTPASAAGLPFNQWPAPAAATTTATVNRLGQAVAALLAGQGNGFGLSNLLGSFGGAPGIASQNLPGAAPGGFANPASNIIGGHAGQQPTQGNYANVQIGLPDGGRSQSGVSHMGRIVPYMGQ